jgi:hypothetical protein
VDPDTTYQWVMIKPKPKKSRWAKSVTRHPDGSYDPYPVWWPEMVAVFRQYTKLERALTRARRRRDLACWLVCRHRDVSLHWLAGRLGLSPQAAHNYVVRGAEIVAAEELTPERVTEMLFKGAERRAEKRKVSEDKLSDWSAPPPPLGPPAPSPAPSPPPGLIF